MQGRRGHRRHSFDATEIGGYDFLMSSLTQIEILLPELHAYARWICSPSDDPEDLVQSAIERSLRTDGRPGLLEDLRPWMFRIIRNLHLDELRRRRIRMEYTVREKRLSGDIGEMRDMPRDVLIRLAFENLDPDKREILFLVDVVGLKYSEAADLIGVAAGTVMSRVSRARRSLREAIEGKDVKHGRTNRAGTT